MSSFNILTGKAVERGPLRGPRRRWKRNIKIDLKEVGVNTRNWFNST